MVISGIFIVDSLKDKDSEGFERIAGGQFLFEEIKMNVRVFLAIRREQRNRRSGGFRDGLKAQHAEKTPSDAVITHVTQVTVEDVTEKATEVPASEDTRSLREIWKQECDVGISYKTFLQRVQTQKWDLQKALHTPKAR